MIRATRMIQSARMIRLARMSRLTNRRGRASGDSRCASVRGRDVDDARMAWTDADVGGPWDGGSGRGKGGGGGRGDDGRDGRGRSWGKGSGVACALAAIVTLGCDAARAAAKQPAGKGAEETTLDALDFGALFSRQLGISGVVGLGAGMAVKTLGSKILITLASFVALLRWLELNDLVDVKWANVHALSKRTSLALLDVNNDGKVDEHDFFAIKAKVINFYTAAVPSVAGFTAGFAAGLARF